jgi:hypothetical protein
MKAWEFAGTRKALFPKSILFQLKLLCIEPKGFPINPADDRELLDRMLRLLLLFELRFPSVPTGGREKLRDCDERLDVRLERTDLQTIVVTLDGDCDVTLTGNVATLT